MIKKTFIKDICIIKDYQYIFIDNIYSVLQIKKLD